MEGKPPATVLNPPRLFQTFKTGFNLVTNHILIILFPLTLDLILWFAPRLRVKAILEPLFSSLWAGLGTASSVELQENITLLQASVRDTLEHSNLVGSLSTLPVGIPSLHSFYSPLVSPLGEVQILEVSSPTQMLLLWLIFIAFGLALGSVFFTLIAHYLNHETSLPSWVQILNRIGNTYLLTLILIALIIGLGIPMILITMVIGMIAPGLAQVIIFFFSFLIIWLLLPLLFSPHGIFVFNLPARKSLLNSIRLVRFYLPGTGFFILAYVLLNQLLNVIWTTAPADSWLMLVGILGHAFTITGLLASSFVFYRNGSVWMEEYLKFIAAAKSQA